MACVPVIPLSSWFVGGNAIIRPVEAGDAAAIAAIYAPNVTSNVVSFELDPPDATEMRSRIAATSRTHPWLVCERAEGVVGYAYASTHLARAAYQWSTNVSVYIDALQHRSCLGRALYTSLFALLRLQGFYNVYGGITLPNAGSVGLHEAMGFRPVGVYRQVGYKFGAWHDVGWWGMELQKKTTAEPLPPLTPPVLQAHSDYGNTLASGTPGLRG